MNILEIEVLMPQRYIDVSSSSSSIYTRIQPYKGYAGVCLWSPLKCPSA